MSNPYETPKAQSDHSRSESDKNASRLLRVWLIVFLLNLPVPLLLGMPFTTPNSFPGLAAIVALYLMAGLLACRTFARFGQCLVAGSLLTAVSQLMPFLHIFAGLIAINSAQPLGFTISNPQSNDGAIRFLLPSILGVAWVALVTGGIIALCGISLGLLVKLIFPKWLEHLLPVGSVDVPT